MANSISRKAAIVGIHEHETRYAPNRTPFQIQAESAKRALEDAGLTKDDVDGLYVSGVTGLGGVTLAEYMNINPKNVDTTSVGGSSFEFHLSHALNAIAAGRIDVAIVTYGSVARSEGRAIGTGGVGGMAPAGMSPSEALELPWGLTLVGNYALVARRHMHQYGTKPEQLAEIAVAVRYHATRNPYAKYRDPITVEDVLNSRMIADPLHMLDCCVISDGGGAVVVASPEVARNCKKPPVWVLGAGEAVRHHEMGNRDITFVAAQQSSQEAFGMAGVKPSDIDMAMIYDSFTITVLCTLEDLGFCKKGEGGAFVEGGRLRFDSGELPINTDGGGLSSNHPGMRGIFLLIEATRQLRGESTAQVPDCRIALAHGTGGAIGTRHSGSTIILGRD